MKRKTWQGWESRIAQRFGCRRSALSGGAAVGTMSDSTHPRLYISVKCRKSHAVLTEWEIAADQARREGKTPVVAICRPGEPSGRVWFVIADDDLEAVAREYKGRQTGGVGGVVGE